MATSQQGQPTAPTRCAECGTLLTDALVLACGHDLCLGCAAGALKQTGAPGLRAVRCLLCSSVTELCEAAAEALIGSAASSSSTAKVMPAPTPSRAPRDILEAPYGQGWQTHPPYGGTPPSFGGANGYQIGSELNRDRGGDSFFGSNGYDQSRGAYGSQANTAFHQATSTTRPPPYLDARLMQGSGNSTSSSAPVPTNVSPVGAYRSPREQQDARFLREPGGLQKMQNGTGPSSIVVPVASLSTPRGMNGRREEPVALLSLLTCCPEHPSEIPSYFCATCECACVCADCVVSGKHHGHEVMKVGRAHEALRARTGALLDEALALEDDFAVVQDKLSWRRKDVERAAARGRASVRSAFARVRAQLADREQELLEALDGYEQGSLSRIDGGSSEHGSRLSELRQLQDTLRARARAGDAVSALNAYAAAKAAITTLRDSFRQDEISAAAAPDAFVGLAGSARAELDLHAEGLASLEEAVASLCERGIEFPQMPGRLGTAISVEKTRTPRLTMRAQADNY